MTGQLTIVCGVIAILLPSASGAEKIELSEDGDQIKIATPELGAAIRKKGYVSGVAGGSLVTKRPVSETPDSAWILLTGSWSREVTWPIGTNWTRN